MGKVTISTVLGYKEYVVENIKNIRGEDEENSDFRIYPDYHKIYRGQTEIVLTKAEYELFMLLSGRPGVIFTKEKIFEILYNEELPESIDVNAKIKRLLRLRCCRSMGSGFVSVS